MSSWRTAWAVQVLAVVGLIEAVHLLGWYWPGSFFHNPASGTWTALAWDFAHGQLYRPVLSSSAFGGTRYMPVLFVMLGTLIRLHFDPIVAGVVLMQASVIAAAIALYAALRAVDVERVLAVPFAASVWASVTYQKFFTDMRVDFLSAMFVAASLAAACVARRDPRARWLWCAGAACVLATFSKATEIVFLVPIVCIVAADGSITRAARFAAATFTACLLLLAGLQWASAGRLVENFQATMTAGMRVSDLWRRALPNFLWQLLGDPFIGLPFVLAVSSLVMAVRRREWSIIDGYFLTSVSITLVISASPGASFNHMIELQIATTFAVAVALQRGLLPDRPVAGVYTVLVLVMALLVLPLPWMPSPTRTLRLLGPRQRATVQDMRAEFLLSTAPYLSLDPIVPVLLDQRPMVLDPFNLNLFVMNDTAAGRSLEARVRARTFATVILDDDQGLFDRDVRPGDAGYAETAARFWAAARPLERVIAVDYEICAVRRPFIILRPR